MEFTEVIKSRRSIRNYLDKSISVDEILPLIECAMYAPSAHNEQPWQFLIINDKKKLEMISGFHQRIAIVKDAPAGVLICGDLNNDRAGGFWVQDCSAATQNFLLASHNAGFGSVWTGIYPQKDLIDKFSKFFDLPSNIVPFAFIPIGYPAIPGKAGNRFKEDKIHINQR